MAKKTVVINVVGLTKALIGRHTPFIKSFLEKGKSASFAPVLPALTCVAQATYTTGKWPSEHGIVGNGWYNRDQCEVQFWKQSNKLILSEKIWDKWKKKAPDFTTAYMFWWYNMYADVEYAVTPRPNYLADGRKIPDCYSKPAGLRDELQEALGDFPLFYFWGPKADIRSSQWIADASLHVDKKHDPSLTFIYLPHLDYCFQKYGHDPEHTAKELEAIDQICRQLVTHYQEKGANVILLSEYGLTDVTRPVHLNREFRKKGWIGIRRERGRELLDPGASKVFCVADHQVAHVYLNDPSLKDDVKQLLNNMEGIDLVLDDESKADHHIDHQRAGDLVVLAQHDAWFTYYYWMDDDKAPDFGRTVEIHRKPGYDPVELFTDPKKRPIVPRVIWKLLKKKLGFRVLMDIIPLDATLVKGSHGHVPQTPDNQPIIITDQQSISFPREMNATDVYDIIDQSLSGKE